MGAWDNVQKARDKNRPLPPDFIKALITGFMEFKGDRLFKEDGSVIGGVGFFREQPVTVIAITRGRTIEENIARNFGNPNPEGYRKALRLIRQAEKFKRPVLIFIDTKGAGCAIEAEERGQGEAIARCLFEISGVKTPVITFITGEGGSGGALALAVGDRVYMLENAIYSILSPEGFSSILYKDSSKAKEASDIMKITSEDLLKLKVIEGIVSEHGDINKGFTKVISEMSSIITGFISESLALPEEELLEKRFNRFRSFGIGKWDA